jgi:predicted metal-dependent hydrolase
LSSRAKSLIFKSSVARGVEIVVPLGADVRWVADKVQSRIPWIRNAQQEVDEGRGQLSPADIDLRALGETWVVDYATPDGAGCWLKVSGERTLTAGADPEDVLCVARILQRWLHAKARASLVPWLGSLAEDRGMAFNRTAVRNQVSRWGSCSAKRNISLNQNLLFLPRHLVEYVLHHELAHLAHLDHSEEYWRSFSTVLPKCRELRRELRALDTESVPAWASPGLDSA